MDLSRKKMTISVKISYTIMPLITEGVISFVTEVPKHFVSV